MTPEGRGARPGEAQHGARGPAKPTSENRSIIKGQKGFVEMPPGTADPRELAVAVTTANKINPHRLPLLLLRLTIGRFLGLEKGSFFHSERTPIPNQRKGRFPEQAGLLPSEAIQVRGNQGSVRTTDNGQDVQHERGVWAAPNTRARLGRQPLHCHGSQDQQAQWERCRNGGPRGWV